MHTVSVQVLLLAYHEVVFDKVNIEHSLRGSLTQPQSSVIVLVKASLWLLFLRVRAWLDLVTVLCL